MLWLQVVLCCLLGVVRSSSAAEVITVKSNSADIYSALNELRHRVAALENKGMGTIAFEDIYCVLYTGSNLV